MMKKLMINQLLSLCIIFIISIVIIIIMTNCALYIFKPKYTIHTTGTTKGKSKIIDKKLSIYDIWKLRAKLMYYMKINPIYLRNPMLIGFPNDNTMLSSLSSSIFKHKYNCHLPPLQLADKINTIKPTFIAANATAIPQLTNLLKNKYITYIPDKIVLFGDYLSISQFKYIKSQWKDVSQFYGASEMHIIATRNNEGYYEFIPNIKYKLENRCDGHYLKKHIHVYNNKLHDISDTIIFRNNKEFVITNRKTKNYKKYLKLLRLQKNDYITQFQINNDGISYTSKYPLSTLKKLTNNIIAKKSVKYIVPNKVIKNVGNISTN